MSLRRPAAHLRRPPSWRRSGDESYWENLKLEGESASHVSRPARTPRPQSAIEGRQLDRWLEHLHGMESDLLRAPARDQVPVFSDRMSVSDKEPSGRAWRGTPTFSGYSSTCGSPSQCESSLGSQESIQTGLYSPPERRGSWERAHIMQAPRKEQAQISCLAPVKIGWLPVQRRVMMVNQPSNPNQTFQDHSASQVKLKQPITPTFQKGPATLNRLHDGEVERSHTGPSAAGARTWHTPDQGSPIIKQVQEKQGSPAYEADKPVCWQALRRTWNTNRLSAHPQSSEHPTGICSEPYRKSLPMKTPSAQPHTPLHRTTSAEPCRSLLHGSTESFKSPLHRTSSGLASSHTSSAVTTLVPQNKVGFSSITISSRKVNRSSSLPSSEGPPCSHSTKFRESHTHETMDQNSRGVTVQRKATIVKVTEQRMMPSSGQSINRAETPQSSHALDTVVHRRKATIIKVTEQRESYSPSKVRSGTRHPEYRHSYTEGAYKENSMWSHGNHSEHTTVPSYPRLNSTERPSSVSAPNASTSDPVKNSGTLHTSTLRLFVNNPPAIAAAAPSELSPKAFGQRSNRPNRPLSCYGNVFAHSEPSKENVTPPTVRKWSCGLPQETNINPVNSLGSLIRPGTAVKEAGQQVADTVKPNRRAKGVSPEPEDTAKRSPPCLTLIKDPQSHQSPEEVLALNAAAIIANIKLQRQLSAKKTPNGKAEKDSTASLRGNTVTDEGKCTQKPPPDRAQCHSQPQAAFIPLSLGPQRSGQTVSLQEALQRSRPHFIARSQDRVQKLEQRAQERRELANSTKLQLDAARRQRRGHGGRIRSCMNDNLFKSRDAAVRGKELRSKHSLADLKKKKEEEKKKEVCLGNRQRVELFKKKLLDQILQRGNK